MGNSVVMGQEGRSSELINSLNSRNKQSASTKVEAQHWSPSGSSAGISTSQHKQSREGNE